METDETDSDYSTTGGNFSTTGFVPHTPPPFTQVDKTNEASTIVLSILGGIVLALSVTKLLHRYSNWRKTPWYALITTWINWLLAVSIIVLIPIDVSSSAHASCLQEGDESCIEPWVHFSRQELVTIWRMIYWFTFVGGWLVVPIMQSYVLTGHFHWHQRLLRAIWENITIYAVGAVVGFVIVIFLLIKKQLSLDKDGMAKGLALAMAASNAYGIIIVLALLGYGLTEWPKKLWRKSKREDAMRNYQFQSYLALEDLDVAQQELEKTLKLVKKYDECTDSGDPNRKYVTQIVSECPIQYKDIKSGSGDYKGTYKEIVRLHSRVINAEREVYNSRALYEDVIGRAWKLQDVLKSENNPNHVIDWTFKHKNRKPTPINQVRDKIDWFWRCKAQVYTLRVGVVLCAIMSACVVWSETLFSVKRVPLSVVYWITEIGRGNTYLLQVGFTVFPVAYIAFCTYWSLFRFKLFKFYRMIPHHNTDANSLLFNSYYLARIINSMAYNFNLIVYNNESAFQEVMGEMGLQNLIIVGKMWNVYLPIILIILCIANLLNWYSKITEMFANAVSCCWKIKINRFDTDEGFMDERVDKGKMILNQEREYKLKNNSLSVDMGINLLKMKKPPVAQEISKGNKWQNLFKVKWGSKKETAEIPLSNMEGGQVPLDDL